MENGLEVVVTMRAYADSREGDTDPQHAINRVTGLLRQGLQLLDGVATSRGITFELGDISVSKGKGRE